MVRFHAYTILSKDKETTGLEWPGGQLLILHTANPRIRSPAVYGPLRAAECSPEDPK